MPQIDYILTRLRQPNLDDARQVLYAIGEWLATGDRESLSRTYDRIRELAREGAPFNEQHVALRGARAVLEGYFATRDGIERVERLTREVAATAEWKTMLRCVASPVDSTWSTEIANRFSPKPEWDELAQRELIALVPMAEGYGYSITPLGRRVIKAVMRADQAVPRIARHLSLTYDDGTPLPPTTDLRDALREAAHTITEYASGPRVLAAVERYRALADAPPTVAELLPCVDGTHRVEWVDYIGRPCAATLVGAVVASWWGPSYSIPCALRPADLTAPARLVDVTP